MARSMVQIPAPDLVEQFCSTYQGSKVDRLTFNLVYSSPQTLFLCKSSSMVLGPYLFCSFCGRFAVRQPGTMAAETAFWGDIFSVSGKQGRFRIPKNPCVDTVKRRRFSWPS